MRNMRQMPANYTKQQVSNWDGNRGDPHNTYESWKTSQCPCRNSRTSNEIFSEQNYKTQQWAVFFKNLWNSEEMIFGAYPLDGREEGWGKSQVSRPPNPEQEEKGTTLVFGQAPAIWSSLNPDYSFKSGLSNPIRKKSFWTSPTFLSSWDPSAGATIRGG